MKTLNSPRPLKKPGFSFVEVLAAIAIIGIVTFLAIPNLIQIKQDGEDKLAQSRAEALNMALASFIQANGKTAANASWGANNDARYVNLRPYLAFSPTNLTGYTPNGYGFRFPTAVTNLSYTNMVWATNSGGTRIE